MATKKSEEMIAIRPLDIKTIPIRIVGDTPLIVHAWSDKAKKMMLDAQTGATKTKAKEKHEMKVFRAKYSKLKELSEVFKAMDSVLEDS